MLSAPGHQHTNRVRFATVKRLPATGELALPDAIKADLGRFIDVAKTVPVDPKSFGVPLTKDEGIEILNRS